LLSSNVLRRPKISKEPVTILMENLCQQLPKNMLSSKAANIERGPLVHTEDEMKTAREESYLLGIEEGHRQGKSEGVVQERDKFQAEVDALESVVDGILSERSRILISSGQDMTKLAMEMAGRIFRRLLPSDSKTVVRAVEDVLTRISEAQTLIIRLNPSEIDVVRNQETQLTRLLSDDSRLEFKADADVSPGGCLVDTPDLHIDASTDSLWQRFENALDDWCANEMSSLREHEETDTKGAETDAA